MSREYEELDGLWASVDRVEYAGKADGAPPERPHQFVYHITIHNDSAVPVRIVGRKWVVTNARGEKMVVEADGVVGQFPRLAPGEEFEYNSYHLLGSDSTAQGAYLARIEVDGHEEPQGVLVKIPPFEMKIPK